MVQEMVDILQQLGVARRINVAGTLTRLGGSLALALMARAQGVRIVRVHDVAPTVQAFRVMNALEGSE